MNISKDQIVALLKLCLETSQNEYEEVKEAISQEDLLFIDIEFEIQVDESAKKFMTTGLSLCTSYFKKKSLLQQPTTSLIREDIAFIAIAEAWKATTSAFNPYNALQQFCGAIAAKHQAIYGLLSPCCQSYLEKFADALLFAIKTGSYPIHCLSFFKDLWIDNPYAIPYPFHSLREAVPTIWVRRPAIEDYTKSYSFIRALTFGETQNLQRRIGQNTAVIDFFWYDKEPISFSSQPSFLRPSIKSQEFQISIETLFLLLGNTSARMTEFQNADGTSGGPLSIYDSSPGRCEIIKNLDQKLCWVGQLMLPILMKDVQGDETIERALKYYKDSLFRSLGVESRIALSMSGLEALYLDKSGTEKTLRLSLMIANLLRYLDFDPKIVKNIIKRSYDIRSVHVHGSKVKKKPQELIELSEKIDEYLRLSILALQYCINSGLKLEDIRDDLEDASVSFGIPLHISERLEEIKLALI